MKERRALKMVSFSIQVMALFGSASAAGSRGLQAPVEGQPEKDGEATYVDTLA